MKMLLKHKKLMIWNSS